VILSLHEEGDESVIDVGLGELQVVTHDADPVNLACLIQGSQTDVIVLPES
jgi:predicted nuclease of predicted toxin-antitoxin system